MNGILIGPAITAGINPAVLGIQFATVEAGTYPIGGQGNHELSSQKVTIEKPFGLATTPFTNEQLRKVLAQLKSDSESAPKNTLLMGELPGGGMKLLARGTQEAIRSMSLEDMETAVKRSVTLADLHNLESGMTVYDTQNAVLTDAAQRGPVILRECYALLDEKYRAHFIGERKPATRISWSESTALALLLKLRLLDEIEWEIAARGKEGREFSSSNGQLRDASGKKLGHFDESAVADVGSYPPIRIGGIDVFDLLGNVWEWTGSLYEAGSPARVLRGGSWNNYNPEFLRAAGRSFGPDRRNNVIGFRLAPPQDS